MITAKYRKALAGENDIELDDPDPMRGFESQYLNVWHLREAVSAGDPAFDLSRWDDYADPQPMDSLRERIALCVEVALDGSHASLLAAAVDKDVVRVEVVRRWTGQGCIAALRLDLPELVAQVRPRVIGWFPSGPAASLEADMAENRERNWPPRGVKLEEIRTDVAAVCMGAANLVASGAIRHPGDAMLREHLAAAMRMKRGDAWIMARRGSTPIDGAYALAGAVHLARLLPAPRGSVIVL